MVAPGGKCFTGNILACIQKQNIFQLGVAKKALSCVFKPYKKTV